MKHEVQFADALKTTVETFDKNLVDEWSFQVSRWR
jgi:hypothetical protein